MMQYCSKMEYGGRPPSSLDINSHLAPSRRWSLVINPPYLMEHRIELAVMQYKQLQITFYYMRGKTFV